MLLSGRIEDFTFGRVGCVGGRGERVLVQRPVWRNGSLSRFCHFASPHPAGVLHLRALDSFARLGGLAVDGVVAAVLQIEVQLLAVVGVLKVAAKIAHRRVGCVIDADQGDLPVDVSTVDSISEHRRHVDRGRRAFDVLAGDASDFFDVPIRIGHPVERAALEDNVGEDAVNPILHLVREAFHDGVGDDQCRHAEHHADDRHERDVAGAEITPAEQKLVHEPVLGYW